MNGMLNLAQLVAHERAMLRSNWGWFVGLGVVLTVMGIAGLVFVGAMTLVAIVLIGWLFLVGGVLEVGHAIMRKGWQGFWLDLLSGILTGLVGLFILLRPAASATLITMLLGILFLVSGFFRIGTGIAIRNPYRGWFIVQGIVSLVLALMILAEWPYSAIWVIGTFVSIDLIFEGLRLVSFGMAVKNLAPIGSDEERSSNPTTPASPGA